MKKLLKCIIISLLSLSAIGFSFLLFPQRASAADVTLRWVNGVPYDVSGNRIILSGNEISLIATTAKADPYWVSGGWNSTNNNVARITYSKYYGCIVQGVSAGTCTIYYDGSTMYYLYDALSGKNLPMVNKQHEEFKIRVVKTADSIRLNKTSVKIKPNGTAKLSYTLSPVDDYTSTFTLVTYSSSNTSVATVDASGNVKGLKNGTATITAKTSSGKTATCTVTVSSGSASKPSSAIKPSKIKLSKSSLSLQKGKSKTLKYTLTPAKAKSTVKWSSSNTKVAKVSSSGKVTAKGYGSAVITVKTANGKTAACKVKVPAPAAKKIKLNKTSLSLKAGKTATLKYTLSPAGAKSKVTFKSSKTSVATVNSKGKVTAKKAGTATITAKTSNGKKATCKVKVTAVTVKKIKLSQTSLNLETGDTATLKYTLSPAGAKSKVTFKSSKTSVATVSSKGKITAEKAGTTTITVKTSNGKKATCTVKVTNPAIPAASVGISGAAAYMKVGESMSLKAAVTPSNTTDTVSWSSSNSAVASVSSGGVVRGLKNGGVTITAKAGSRTASVQIAVVSGDVYDISKGELKVLAGDVPGNRTVQYCGNTYTYNTSQGLTVVQSDPSKSNSVVIGGGKVTFANVHMSGRYVSVYDYHTQADDPYTGDITIEFMAGTENSFSAGNAPIDYTCTSTGTNKLIIQGSGKVDLYSGYGPALYGRSRITIKGVTMTVRVVTETCAVIGTYAGVDCSNITVASGAHITAYGGYRAVGAGQGGTNTNISVASGTVTHIK